MRLDAALGVCLLGVSLLALESRTGRFAWLAVVPAGIGLLTLAQSSVAGICAWTNGSRRCSRARNRDRPSGCRASSRSRS